MKNYREMGIDLEARQPALTLERNVHESGLVTYDITLNPRVTGIWDTPVGPVGIKALDLDRQHATVTVDCGYNTHLQAKKYKALREIPVNKKTGRGLLYIGRNRKLTINLGGPLVAVPIKDYET